MPDENNNLNPTNQNNQFAWNYQASWNTNQNNQTSWNYNFESFAENYNNWNFWTAQTQQDQNPNLWRTWRFMTPDESIQSNTNSIHSGQEIATDSDEKSRSWKFLTPDEEDKKFTSKYADEWATFTVQQPQRPIKTPEEINAEEDAFFENFDMWDESDDLNNTTNNEILNNEVVQTVAPSIEQTPANIEPTPINIEPAPTSTEPSNIQYNNNFDTPNNPPIINDNNNLNNNIQNNNIPDIPGNFPFANENNNFNNDIPSNTTPEENTDSQPYNDYELNIEDNNGNNTTVENNTLNNQESIKDSTDYSTHEQENKDNDDRLLQEDKNVEESFGINQEVKDEWNIDIPNDQTAQNVEDIISSPEPSNETENSTTNLHIENLWTDVTENDAGDIISDTWWSTEEQDKYIPNESEFSQMSNVLNSAPAWQVDLTNTDENLSNINEDNSWNENLNDLLSDPTIQENVASIEITEKDENNNVETEKIDLNNTQSSTESNNSNNNAPMEISLDSILINNPTPENNDTQNNTNQETTQTTNNISESNTQIAQNNSATAPQKKKKKNRWVWVLILVIIGLGFCSYRFIKKMAPDILLQIKDKINISNTLNWNNNTIEPEINTWNIIEDEDWEIINNGSWTDENGEITDNEILNENENLNNNNSGNNQDTTNDEPLDPNSLAALLENDNNQWNENNQTSWEIITNEEWLNNNWPEESTWNDQFNQFGEIDNILSNNDLDIKRLSWFIAQWEYFQERWTNNGNNIIAWQWQSIKQKAEELKTKLENWEEIDTSIFNNLEDTISKLTETVSKLSNLE